MEIEIIYGLFIVAMISIVIEAQFFGADAERFQRRLNADAVSTNRPSFNTTGAQILLKAGRVDPIPTIRIAYLLNRPRRNIFLLDNPPY
jgi:hypothetical protein